jgi:uncharacterized protein involved in exopolysaccharide biosynthesis
MATPLAQWIAQAQAYWRLVVKYKYKWYILVSSLALALVFNVMIARFPNVYEATTTILVDPQQIPEKYVSPAVNSDTSSRLNTLTQQVLSRTRLQEIIDKLNLYPEQRRSISAKELIEEMRHDITIQVKVKQGSVPELGTFTVSYQGKNPMLTAEVANELANSFIQWNINSREQKVAGTKDFLSSKLDAAKQKQQAGRFIVLDVAEVPEKPIRPRRKLLILLSTSVAFGLSIFCVLKKDKNNPAVNTEMELNALLPKGARIMGMIPRIVIASDARRDRRLTIFACIVCGLLCLALISVIWNIHLVL